MREIKAIKSVKVETFLKSYGKGQFFGVKFVKKDGTIRTLNGHMRRDKGGKKVGTAKDPYLVVYSNNDQGFRCVNLDTVISINALGNTYVIR